MVKAFTQNGVTGAYELPRKMLFSFSYTHDQNPFMVICHTSRATHWFCNWPDKEHNHDLFLGLPSTIITTTLPQQ
jgi:hypothetical protein